MKRVEVSFPIIALFGLTRGFLGAGIALLAADRFDLNQRKLIGRTLFGIGLATTVPLILEIFGQTRLPSSAALPAAL